MGGHGRQTGKTTRPLFFRPIAVGLRPIDRPSHACPPGSTRGAQWSSGLKRRLLHHASDAMYSGPATASGAWTGVRSAQWAQ